MQNAIHRYYHQLILACILAQKMQNITNNNHNSYTEMQRGSSYVANTKVTYHTGYSWFSSVPP